MLDSLYAAAFFSLALLPGHAFLRLNTPMSLTILLAVCAAIAIASVAWPPVHHHAPRRKK
jgi:hypothetical protein